VLLAWSGGKDSAWALHRLRADPEVQIAGLFTTVHRDRVAVHDVPLRLLRAQAHAAGETLRELEIPSPCPNEVYERVVGSFVAHERQRGVTHLAFGDLFLEDIRRYRERQFAGAGVELVFPLWGEPTREVAAEMTASGLRAWITCVNGALAPRSWAGSMFDADFVKRVPPGIDPCGENGEFHTFVVSGPMLRGEVHASPGELSERGGFVYADLN
jgi:uncharacterized protein (TIGR00290 family)